jgi:Zn-dependent protease
MGWSIPIGRVAGIAIKLHVTFLLLLAWIALGYLARGGAAAAVAGVGFTLLVFACVVLHEFGHALAARRYGIATPDITLLPIGGVARLARMPDDPRQELVVALAGPAVNVIIVAVLMLAGASFTVNPLGQLDSSQISMMEKLLATNVFLVLFNLLPAFPMDGGRVLRALLALRMDYVAATQRAASVGQGFAFFFGFIGLFYNPLLVFVALFVYLGASQEAAMTQMRNVAAQLPATAAMIADVRTLPPDAPLSRAVELLLGSYQREVPLVDASGHLTGLLTRDAIIAALSRGYRGAVGAIAHTDVPTLPATAPLEEAFVRMAECRCPALAILGADDRLAGIITAENVGEMMMVQRALAQGRLAARRGSLLSRRSA